jgi:hypothetical protein
MSSRRHLGRASLHVQARWGRPSAIAT